uniref:Small ribosomal subunit protein uS15 n=1 Tax=Gorilla gorilla gorilla TaxID=9595 RepID=A0A2I2YGI6_GORGO
MGCMHAPRKGLSRLALPYQCSITTWLKLTSDEMKIYKLANKTHGVAQVCFVTGNKILRILKSKGLAPDLPEDLYHLIKKAVAVQKHLERNRKDKDSVGFTIWLDIIRQSESSLPVGNMSHLQPLSWSHKFVYVLTQ